MPADTAAQSRPSQHPESGVGCVRVATIAEPGVPLTRRQELLDRLGIFVSTACAIHCVLMPLVISFLLASGAAWLADERFEWAILCITIAVGFASLLPSYLRKHRQSRCLVLFSIGIALLLTAHILFGEASGVGLAAIVFGAVLISTAHILNARLCRHCHTCHHDE